MGRDEETTTVESKIIELLKSEIAALRRENERLNNIIAMISTIPRIVNYDPSVEGINKPISPALQLAAKRMADSIKTPVVGETTNKIIN